MNKLITGLHHLGEMLQLPSWEKSNRSIIEERLNPIKLDWNEDLFKPNFH